MRAFIGCLWSGGYKSQVPDRLGRRPHLDFDVVAEAIQTVHQLALVDLDALVAGLKLG